MNPRALLQQATGMNLSHATVERALGERMASRALQRREDYLALLAGAELEALIELVVVPESWMFRDAAAFAAATDWVRRRLAAQPGRARRILSVPCAGGEEPYSMAMALLDAGVAPGACDIDGLDLSAAAIARAVAGRYTRNAFRGRQLEFRDRYFTREGDEYLINEAVRAQVSFSQGNLLAFDVSASAGRYDLIFCRNLLIYFDEPTAAAAIGKLSTLLADDGVLFAGYAELPVFCRHGFTPLPAPGAFALQKQVQGSMAPTPRPRATPRSAPLRKPAPPLATLVPLSAPTMQLAQSTHTTQSTLSSLSTLSTPSTATQSTLSTLSTLSTPSTATQSSPSAPAVLSTLATATPATPAAANRRVHAPAKPAAPAAAPDSAALLAQARKQADAGDYRGAAASCHRALAASPDLAEAYFILGMVSECEQKPGVADDCWRRCVYLQPDHYEALCHLALLSERVGNAAQAAVFKRRAARIYQRREAGGKGAP